MAIITLTPPSLRQTEKKKGKSHHNHPHTFLTSSILPRRLTRRPLRPLLTLDPPRLSPRRARRALRLLRLLLALRRRLLFLACFDGFLARGRSCFGTLGAAFFDYVEGGADDAALLFDGAAGAFFGDFLDGGKVLALVLMWLVCRHGFRLLGFVR